MGFSGVRALALIALFVILLLGVTKLGMPGWILPLGLFIGGGVLKGWEKRSTA